MDLTQVLLTAGVGLAASLVTALVTHALTRAQERRKHERDIAAKLAALKSTERSETHVMAVQYAHSCFIVEGPSDQERDRVFLPLGSRITLGSAPENHIRLESTERRVSRIHAAFSAQGSTVFAEPLGTAHGLAVNGQVITKPRKLAVGDVITVPGVPYKITFVPLAPD